MTEIEFIDMLYEQINSLDFPYADLGGYSLKGPEVIRKKGQVCEGGSTVEFSLLFDGSNLINVQYRCILDDKCKAEARIVATYICKHIHKKNYQEIMEWVSKTVRPFQKSIILDDAFEAAKYNLLIPALKKCTPRV